MASIQKRGSRWFARYQDGTGREHGRRFDRKADVQKWLDEATAALVTGSHVDPRDRTTVAEYTWRWATSRPHSRGPRDGPSRSSAPTSRTPH